MGIRVVLTLGLLAAAAPSGAGTLYRCVGADGVNNYSSSRIAGAQCAVVATYSPERSAAAAPAAAPAASAKRVEFRTADAGSAIPAAPASTPPGTRVSRGAVYRYERDGVTHYTNVKPAGVSSARMLFSYVETCFACAARPSVDFGNVRLNTTAFASEIAAAARAYGVDESLVRAVIHAESAFNPNALSHKGAQGLMQLMPPTASRFGVVDAFTPGDNIRGGVQYLAWLLKRFDGNIRLAAAGYNAGEGAVDRYGGVPPYAETQRYVERVAVLEERYRRSGAPAPLAAGAVSASL
ncbi:lytic transglycosylase domain-containing protein [Coralloluteibacterium stylophorae]|uniref:Lytic transglycosylase domain-containing protein n=1 Tax=Coralloluteibacterium stylophorae TaxID=1776034 RepID=A0AAP2CAL6_9GAMM|nr:lytic transglycosylase domain-containing protein [Coralloluteibacterium stylophorae]MBS7456681.1 lytic transglycosylase domain-containing protein [Coralloluteibacterium stylophorae]